MLAHCDKRNVFKRNINIQRTPKVVNIVQIITNVKKDKGKPCRWNYLGQATGAAIRKCFGE